MRRMSNIKHDRLLAVLLLLAVCLVPAAAWAKTINIEIEKVKYFPATGEGATIRLYKIGESSGKAPTSFSLVSPFDDLQELFETAASDDSQMPGFVSAVEAKIEADDGLSGVKDVQITAAQLNGGGTVPVDGLDSGVYFGYMTDGRARLKIESFVAGLGRDDAASVTLTPKIDYTTPPPEDTPAPTPTPEVTPTPEPTPTPESSATPEPPPTPVPTPEPTPTPTAPPPPRRREPTPPPFNQYTEEELEDFLTILDYDTPLVGMLGTGDDLPVYPFVFGGIGLIAAACALILGRKGKEKNA